MLFKKNKAITIDKMNVIQDVVINSESVKFNLKYSNTTLKPEEVPKLLSDVMQIYAMVKPVLYKQELDKLEGKVNELKSNEDSDEPIDLSEIPF